MPGFQADIMGAGAPPLLAAAINGTAQLGQTATGSTQATAFPITASTTEFTTVAASTGALLPAAPGPTVRVNGGDAIVIANQGAQSLSVYPPVGGRIGLAAANAAVAVASGKSAIFLVRGDGNYFAIVGA